MVTTALRLWFSRGCWKTLPVLTRLTLIGHYKYIVINEFFWSRLFYWISRLAWMQILVLSSQVSIQIVGSARSLLDGYVRKYMYVPLICTSSWESFVTLWSQMEQIAFPCVFLCVSMVCVIYHLWLSLRNLKMIYS
jgi:hypothetical protein